MIRGRERVGRSERASLDWLRKRLQEANPDLLRAMVETVVYLEKGDAAARHAAFYALLQTGMRAELRNIERAVSSGARNADRGLKTELRRQVSSADGVVAIRPAQLCYVL